MNKLKLFLFASELHPCPPFNGFDIYTKIEYNMYGRYIIKYGCVNGIWAGSGRYYHVRKWADMVSEFVNIEPINILITYE